MPIYKCSSCGYRYDRWITTCGGCSNWGTMIRTDPVQSSEFSTPSPLTLEDVEALEGERVNTGIRGFNRVLGTNRSDHRSGIPVPSCILFGGGQGCGKTTLLLTALASMREKHTLLLSTEQTLGEIKSSLIGIGLGHKAGQIRAYSLLEEDCLLEVAMRKIEEHKPRVLVIDSVNELHDDSIRIRDRLERRVRLIRHFKTNAEEHHRAIILTAHLTKDDAIGGRREQLHIAHTVMMLVRQDARIRILHCPEKNRFGDIAEKAYFEMDRHGLREIERNESAEVPARPKAPSRAKTG